MDYQNNARQHCCRKTDKTNNDISTHEVQVEETRIKTSLTPNSLKCIFISTDFQLSLPRLRVIFLISDSSDYEKSYQFY